MIEHGKWKIWAEDEQWVMTDKAGTGKHGQPTIAGNAFYYGTIESLFRGLYQQCVRDGSTDCKTLEQVALLATTTAARLEKVLRDALEFSPSQNGQKGAL